MSLDELAAAHEEIDWSEVHGISQAEAAAWTQRLDMARE